MSESVKASHIATGVGTSSYLVDNEVLNLCGHME